MHYSNKHAQELIDRLSSDESLGSWLFKDKDGNIETPKAGDAVFTLVLATHAWFIESSLVLTEPFPTHQWMKDGLHILADHDDYQQGAYSGDKLQVLTVRLDTKREFALSELSIPVSDNAIRPRDDYFSSMGVGAETSISRIGFKTYEAAFLFQSMMFGSALLDGWMEKVISDSNFESEMDAACDGYICHRKADAFSYAPKLEKNLLKDNVRAKIVDALQVYKDQPVYQQAVARERWIHKGRAA